jgi:uncharacterized protein with PQ loop repeat
MNIWAKIGWGALGFLVLISVAVMFLLHWAMGLFFACFVAMVLWWVFGVLKKKVDIHIRIAADTLSLAFKPHPFRYAAMEGEYKGLPSRTRLEESILLLFSS